MIASETTTKNVSTRNQRTRTLTSIGYSTAHNNLQNSWIIRYKRPQGYQKWNDTKIKNQQPEED